MIDMRLGRPTDIPYILKLTQNGIETGAFAYSEINPIDGIRRELLTVTEMHDRNIQGADYLFVFSDSASGNRVGFGLLTGRNNSAGLASHLEIRMFITSIEERGKGYGKQMLKTLLDATPGHRLEVSCLPQSTRMMKLLEKNGFSLDAETQGGKKTYSFANY